MDGWGRISGGGTDEWSGRWQVSYGAALRRRSYPRSGASPADSPLLPTQRCLSHPPTHSSCADSVLQPCSHTASLSATHAASPVMGIQEV